MMVRSEIGLVIVAVAMVATACGSPAPVASTGSAPASGPASGPPSIPPSETSTASPIPAALRVVGVEVTADPAGHIGACPLEITFSARISVAGGAGSVAFKWISSDGDASDMKTMAFAGPGSQVVTSTWTVDRDTVPTHAGWSSVEIISPTSPSASSFPSAQAPFVFTCDADDDIEAIGFGIGGSDADCSIAKNARTFAPTDPVRMVANWWPSLAAGTVVTVRLERDGELVDGYPVTSTFHELTKCVHGTVSRGFLAPGHYRIDLAPDTARAIGGDFDIK